MHSHAQVESTLSLQALQPRVKELQAKYADDPENLQLETARLYKEAGVNPLAGCFPTLATIPVFIGLYNALSNAAKEGLLTEGFFWIPSLGGPTTIVGPRGLGLWGGGGKGGRRRRRRIGGRKRKKGVRAGWTVCGRGVGQGRAGQGWCSARGSDFAACGSGRGRVTGGRQRSSSPAPCTHAHTHPRTRAGWWPGVAGAV